MTAQATTTQKCRACIDTGTLGPVGECTDPAHQVASDVHPRTANEPDLPPLPPKWSDPGYLAREAERRRTAVPPEALSAALTAWDARITGPIVSDTEGTEDALQEVVEAAFRAAPRRAPEPPVALRDVGRARRALRALRDHLGEDPGPAVVDALNSALLAYDPPAEPPADLREALARLMYGHHPRCKNTGGCLEDCEVGIDDQEISREQYLDAVLAVVQAHVAAEVERARAAAEQELDEALRERDETEAIADRLAYSIAPQAVIGEHSSGNSPWLNALDLAPTGGWQAAVERARAEGAAEALRALSDELDVYVDPANGRKPPHYVAATKRAAKVAREHADRTTGGAR